MVRGVCTLPSACCSSGSSASSFAQMATEASTTSRRMASVGKMANHMSSTVFSSSPFSSPHMEERSPCNSGPHSSWRARFASQLTTPDVSIRTTPGTFLRFHSSMKAGRGAGAGLAFRSMRAVMTAISCIASSSERCSCWAMIIASFMSTASATRAPRREGRPVRAAAAAACSHPNCCACARGPLRRTSHRGRAGK